MRLLSRISLVVVIFTAQIAAQVIFSEGFEGSTSGWTVSPTVNGWEFGTPTVGPASTPEGVRCAGTVLNGYPATYTYHYLTSQSITLPDLSDIYLSFKEWLSIYSSYDIANLQIEQNGSGSWATLRSTSTSNTTWQYREFDLSSYRNSSIRLRFMLYAGPYNYYYGWYIDDIKISRISPVNVAIQAGANGSATPSGTRAIRPGTLYSINASPNTNYRFDQWTIQNGTISITDPYSASTTISPSTDATITANFRACSVYTIESSPHQYNYTQHYYSGDASSGVRFKFIASQTGNYSITIQKPVSHTNYLQYFRTDASFTGSSNTVSNSSTITFAFRANAGENHYFRVYTSSSYYNYNFNINSGNALGLTVSNDGNGSTTPSGQTAVVSGVQTSISATGNPGFRFDNWSILTGSPTITDPTSYSTYVTTSADATIRANFRACSVYTIESSPHQYNYTQHFYSGDASSGVRYKFIASQTGNYSITIQKPVSHTNYLQYFGTDASFTSSSNTVSNSSTISFVFRANAGENHYFRVYSSSSSYYNYTFNINSGNALSLNVSNDGDGSTIPSGQTAVVAGAQTSISATGNPGFRFDNWSILSGSPTITDPASYSTYVTTSADASIRASFKPCSIYTITQNQKRYNYTKNYYQIQTSPYNGVRFKFTPSSSGTYAVIISNIESHYNYLYDYGTDSLFNSYNYNYYNSSTYTLTFSAIAGQSRYFLVSSGSSSYYNFNFDISYSPPLSLTISNNGNGSTTPSGLTSVVSGVKTSISATANTGYRFNNWSIVSGSPVIDNISAYSTYVATSSDASIRANFRPCSVYTIDATVRQYNYTQHSYLNSQSSGVRFKFTAPSTGTFAIALHNIQTHYNYLYYYGRDSLFNTYTRSIYNSTNDTLITITANAGENHFFHVYTSNSSAYNYDFTIHNTSLNTSPMTLTISKNGNGWVSPSGSVSVRSGRAINISAVPSGGYIFQNWTVVKGNTVIASPASPATAVSVTTDSSEIRANFQINPNTKPNVQISDINISSHPDICLTASVTDSAGRSIIGLDTNNFILKQDSITVPFQLSTVSNVAGVSVSLVIDISGSMSTDLPAAKNAALQYVRSMGPLDRCAIVSFDDVVTVEQTITSDTSLLISAISRLTDRNNTAILNGAYTGVQQLLQETNTSAVIIYSDGLDNSSSTPITTVINSARQNSIRIYSIGLGSSADRSVLGALADSTGGYYTYSPTVAGLAGIYAQIKSDVQAQYILCYQSPDIVFNGDTHEVILSVSLNNRTSKDTVYWNENNSPPVITLTTQTAAMIGVNQTPNQALTISADVTDDGTVRQVRLFYRSSSSTTGAFTELVMPLSSGTRYQYTIPAAQIISPGIDFYILATDNFNLIGRSPNVLAPETQPYVIPVGNDVPVITHTPANCAIPALDLTISPTITDQNGISIAILYFKRGNETFYTIDTMSLTSANIYSGTVPGSMISTNGIDYYFRAFDSRGTAVRHPRSGSIHLSPCGNVNPPVANAGRDTTLFTTSSNCVAAALLNGTGSTNSDGGTLTYSWTGPFTGSLPGATQSINLGIGTNQIILSVTNNAGLTDLDTVDVNVRDTFPPSPVQPTLQNITAECSVTLTPPTATDNCGSIINGTTATTTFNTQGIFDIEWMYRDASGNTSRQQQRIIIDDNTPPGPLPPLTVITGNCSSGIISAPTASDNCGSIVTATTNDPLTYSQPGSYTITWRYTDGNSNTSTQTQSVIINDITPPVPVIANLTDLTATCSLTVTTIPTAFDSCTRKTISGTTTNPLTYSNTGTYTITWTYSDSSGNRSSQEQKVSIIDVTAPVPNVPVLDTIRGECSATITTTPVATDNCCGTIPGVTSDPLTYSTEGSYTITWRYTDRSGNVSTQTQQIIIDDITPPVPLVTPLPDLQGECSVSISTPPQASDNCGTTITATTSNPLVYTQQGTHTITWLYDDLRGNRVTQTQSVIIRDITPPVLEQSELPVIISACNVELTPPFANDNCAGKIAASTPSLSITNQGTHTVIWTYNDGNGNTITQNQTVIIKDSIPPVFAALSNKMIATKSAVFGSNVPIDTARATDNCTRVAIQGVRDDGLRLDTLYFEGTTRITWTACDTNNNCSTASQTITIVRNHAPALQIPADTSLSEGEILSFAISASDSDGTVPSLFIDSLKFPFVFKDSANGRAALSLRPGCTDHGIYTIRVHATDGIDTTTKTFVVNIKDINYPPEFDTTSYYVAHEMVEFKTNIKVYDCDNPNPKIRIVNAPKGAQFTDNNNGTGTFTWTPSGNDNGFYMVIFEAQDDMTTVRDTIIIEITDVNAYPPELTVSFSDSTVPLHLPVVIYATAKDRDGTPTMIKVSALPSGALFESDNNGTALVRWTPADTGIFQFNFVAIDAADTTVKVSKQVQIKVANINVTGPKFSSVQNFVINQNKQFSTTIEARDPDGTIPVLRLKSGQQTDLTFKDNGNGTATISWIPPCNVSGTFNLTATASDQSFTDSVTFSITVRDVNCAPVIFRTSDINARTGEMVRVYVRAYDPDGDTVIPTLSVGCALPGHTFTSSGNGTGVFRWQASYESGSYPVTFFASDGIETDSFTMHININKTGYITIISTTPGSSIYATPNGSFAGEFLGIDSSRLGVAPGIYHFEINKTGYRSERFAVKVFADSSVVKTCALKPSIPLMTSLLDTTVLVQAQSLYLSPSAFADLNSDGYLDYTVLSPTGIKVYPGLDSTGTKYNSKSYDLPDSIPGSSIFHFGFIDWNNDKFLDCIYSDLTGNIIVANFRTGTFESVVSVPGGKLYMSVLDVNNDNKKDLVVHNEGYGLSVYLNQGTDNAPVFISSYQLLITSGQTPATLHGPLTFIDIDGNGTLELLIKNGNTPSLFRIANNFSEMSYIEDLNCAGKRITSDSLTICQIGSPYAMPHIILRTATQSMLFSTHLLGDVNNDNKVDIRDISKISRLWEITDTDPLWDPQCNLRLSTSGQEKIDIRDISSASKSWELQQ